MEIYSTKGAAKRSGTDPRARVYRDPNAARPRVSVVFDWDGAGWQSFAADPEVPGIMQEAGAQGTA